MARSDEKTLVDFSKGDSKLVGINVGRYPSHHFIVLPEPLADRQVPLKVTNCGFDLMRAGVYRQRENSDVCSFELVNEGEVVYATRGVVHRCRPGDLFIIHMGSDYRMECVSPLAKVSCVGFAGSLLNEILADLHLHRADCLRPGDPEPFSAQFELIAQLAAQSGPGQLTDIAAEGYRLLLRVSGELRRGGEPPPLFREIVAMFRSRLGERLRMDAAAKKYNLSQSAFFGLFRRYLGITPAEYLTRLRIQYAERLLRESEFSIKEIASRCGYDNQMYFSQVFRARTGVSPTGFRRRDKK